MSSATSSPARRASSTRWRKSASLPSAGWMDLWPPSSPPIAHGLPTSSGAAAGRPASVGRRPGGAPPLARLAHQAGPHPQVEPDLLAGLDPLGQVAAPGPEVVDPGGHAVEPAAERRGAELAAPAVIAKRLHRPLAPGPPAPPQLSLSSPPRPLPAFSP